MSALENPPAFPSVEKDPNLYDPIHHFGMSLRDWFAGQALANSAICNGTAPAYQLDAWFGYGAGITKPEIVAKQALEYADALLSAREAGR